MVAAVRSILQVLAGVVCLETALGILSPTIALQLAHRAAPPELIGLIGSAYFGGFLLGTLSCHRVIDRVGHIRSFAVFAAVAANATLLLLIFDQVYLWVVLRIIGGYAIAGQYLVIESWLNDKASNENRGRIFSIYMMVSWAASGVSPLALNLGDPTGHLLLTLAAIALVTSLLPLALTRIGNPEIGEREHFGLIRLYNISPTGIVACFGSGVATPAFYALLPAYMVDAGYSTGQLSFVYSFSTLAGLLAQFPIGYLADHIGRRPLMLATSLGSALTAVALYLAGDRSFAVLAGLIFVFEGLMAPLYGLGVGQTSDYIEKKDFVAASSGLLFAWGLGSAVGPMLAGGLIGAAGQRGLFLFMAAALGVFVLFLIARMLMRRAKAAREQLNYVAVPLTQGTYGAPELDPRSEPTPHPHKRPEE
ncbi:MAG TPA: MFS transporter [Dongiaceae bacterium]|nr:MFS transporter [Dongiaceae bacterium]